MNTSAGPRSNAAWAWWLLGTFGLVLGQGHHVSPALLIIGVAAMLRFVRLTRWFVGAIAFIIAHVVTWELAYRGMVPLPTPARIGMETGVSTILVFCLLVHRFVSDRNERYLTTLVFPCAWASVDLVLARLSPGGTWGSVAYSYVDTPWIAQVASLTGWTGLTFLTGWLASSIDWSIARLGAGQPIRSAAIAVGVAMSALVTFGVWRSSQPLDADRMEVACVVPPATFNDEILDDLWRYTRGVEMTDDARDRAIERIRTSRNEHMNMFKREVEAGARLVISAEANAVLTAAEEPLWIEAARQLAIEHDAFIGLGMSVFRPRSQESSLNKFLLVAPSGDVRIDFLKVTRPPGASHDVGELPLPVFEVDDVAASCAICFDLDFPHILAGTGQRAVDVFLAPSNDWDEAAATHDRMARLRAVEQGFNLVRPTKDGVSSVADARGRTIAMLRLTDGQTGTLRASVPTRGVSTLYGRIGDLFPFACATIVIPLALWLGRRRHASV